MAAIAAQTQSKVLEYDLTVGLSAMEGRGFYYPVDTLPTSRGRLYVVNRSVDGVDRGVRVTMCDIDSEYYGTFGSAGDGDGQFVYASGIAEDNSGRVYIADEYANRITVFDLDGNFLSRWGRTGSGEGELDGPSGLAIGANDTVFVSDTHNHRVQRFTPSGVALDSFGSLGSGEGQFDMPWGLTVAPSGDVYVADWGNERVQAFDDGGRFAQKLRGQATESAWAKIFLDVNKEEAAARKRADLEPDDLVLFDSHDPHEESSHVEKLFWSPVSVKLDSEGRLYVTESNRHRIQIYRRVS